MKRARNHFTDISSTFKIQGYDNVKYKCQSITYINNNIKRQKDTYHLRAVGRANNNANANGGLAYANANNAFSNSNTNNGGRLANIKFYNRSSINSFE